METRIILKTHRRRWALMGANVSSCSLSQAPHEPCEAATPARLTSAPEPTKGQEANRDCVCLRAPPTSGSQANCELRIGVCRRQAASCELLAASCGL